MTNFPPDAAVFRYKPACVLRATGDDSASFLQGQFSNDLARIGPGRSVYGLWLDRKGRVVADSHVVADAQAKGFWIASMESPASVVVRRLEDFIVADDVAIEDLTPGWNGLSVIGPGAGAWLGREPRAGLLFPGRRDSGENWEWLYPDGARESVEGAVAGARRISADEVDRLRVAAAIPSVPADIGPADLPNEGRLEDAALSYSKGCYLGQEVMARIKALGRVRRKLVRVAGDGTPPPVPAGLWSGERREGELRSAVADAAGPGYSGLALISIGAASAGAALALSQGGAPSVRMA